MKKKSKAVAITRERDSVQGMRENAWKRERADSSVEENRIGSASKQADLLWITNWNINDRGVVK